MQTLETLETQRKETYCELRNTIESLDYWVQPFKYAGYIISLEKKINHLDSKIESLQEKNNNE